MTRPLLELVARAICRAFGADPDQHVYRNQTPESGVLYLRWQLYQTEARAAMEGCHVRRTRSVLKEAHRLLAGADDQDARILRERVAKLLEKLGGVCV